MAVSFLSEAVGKSAIIKCIQQQISAGTTEPKEPLVLALLKTLTKELIQAYVVNGYLKEDPYAESRKREIYLNKSEIAKKLAGKVVLVTGGEGCVGGDLLKKLIEIDVKRLISVDKARCDDSSQEPLIDTQKASVKFYAADIKNYEALKEIFELEKPDIVFHLAAQRQPGLAEIEIRETVATNVFGTENMIQLCETYGVQQCIFSSTGKASRYFTNDVYAGSKKLAEWLFAQAAQQGRVKYGMVRFTHIIENSIVSEKIEQGIQHGVVKLHSPDLYLFAQNNTEAVNLLLNALVFSESKSLNFLVVRNLGWVVDILELALFKILQSGNNVPIYFEGFTPGYNEMWFPGQINPNSITEVNPLINVIESSRSTLSSCEDMIVSKLPLFSSTVLTTSLSALKVCTDDQSFPEIKLKKVMASSVKDVARSIFLQVAPEQILEILKLGINYKLIELEGTSIRGYADIVEILVQGLYGRLRKEMFATAKLTYSEFSQIVEMLKTLPNICNEVAYLQSVCNSLSSHLPACSLDLRTTVTNGYEQGLNSLV
jgi:hypothetical protein